MGFPLLVRRPQHLARIAAAVGGVLLLMIAIQRMRPQDAPDVSFSSITGEKFRLSELREHPVLITFWASDCRTCLTEIPGLEGLYRDFSSRGLYLIAVAMSYDMPSRVLAIVESRKLPYWVTLDPLARVAGAFGHVELVPATFLIAPDGTIRYKKLGALDFPFLRAQINSMLGES